MIHPMGNGEANIGGRPEDAADPPVQGPWNPGIQSQVPKGLRHLSTIFRPENVYTSMAAVAELQGLTGFSASELVAFRPQRLALHELLIRVTADFAVPDGSRIGDLGINFREIAGLLFDRYLLPEMEAITAVYERTRRELQNAMDAALAAASPGRAQAAAPGKRWPASRLFARAARRRGAPPVPSDRAWGPGHIAECERLAASSEDSRQRIVYRTLARVMSALFATQGHGWGTRELIVSVATDMACNDCGSDAIGRAIEPLLARAARTEGYDLLPRQERPVVINTKGPVGFGQEHAAAAAKETGGRHRRANGAILRSSARTSGASNCSTTVTLGAAYKYAGAFTAEELQIVDQKLDRYMARKHRRGDMTHLLSTGFASTASRPNRTRPEAIC